MRADCIPAEAEHLRRVNALLKLALALPKRARAEWVERLAAEQRELAPALAALLANAPGPFMRKPVTRSIFAARGSGRRPQHIHRQK